jgi:alginate O-acetyltransferase complex protein AlgI
VPFFSYTFLYFLLAVVGARWAVPRLRVPWLLLASYVFYCHWRPSYGLLLAGLTLLGWGGSLAIDRWRERRRLWLILGVTAALGALAFFKYAQFFVTQGHAWFGASGSAPPALGIVLPLGISFVAFQVIASLVDTARGAPPVRSLPIYALYLAFFPKVTAGPIARPSELVPQLLEPAPFRAARFASGLELVLLGFFKKMVLADRLAVLASAVLNEPAAYSRHWVWLGALCYTLQIYCDFSGYTDIARGAARMLGYELPQNFNFPYLSASPTEFWRRWHMTLSRWLRDYLYIPLGGNRRGELRRNANLMITMALGGLWHGAGWTFVVWGVFHGVLLVGHRLWQRATDGSRLAAWRERWAYRVMAVAVTFVLVTVGWVFFQARSLGAAWDVLERMFGGAGGSARPAAGDLVWVWRVLAVVAAGHVLAGVRPIAALWEKAAQNPWLAPLRGLAWAGAIAACFLLSAPPADFIYRMF